MSEIIEIIEAQIEKFDALRETFGNEAERCFLIQRVGETSRFDVVLELLGGWHLKWNEYRQQMRVAVATLDNSFADYAAQTSYFAFGVPDADGEIDVYETDDASRDKVRPNGQNPYWKFYVARVEKERFTIPV